MKKLFTIGLLALAISASAEAKTIVRSKNSTKNNESKKAVLKFQDCTAGMTSCGWSYMFCDNAGPWTDEQNLELNDGMEAFFCG